MIDGFIPNCLLDLTWDKSLDHSWLAMRSDCDYCYYEWLTRVMYSVDGVCETFLIIWRSPALAGVLAIVFIKFIACRKQGSPHRLCWQAALTFCWTRPSWTKDRAGDSKWLLPVDSGGSTRSTPSADCSSKLCRGTVSARFRHCDPGSCGSSRTGTNTRSQTRSRLACPVRSSLPPCATPPWHHRTRPPSSSCLWQPSGQAAFHAQTFHRTRSRRACTPPLLRWSGPCHKQHIG